MITTKLNSVWELLVVMMIQFVNKQQVFLILSNDRGIVYFLQKTIPKIIIWSKVFIP